MSRIMGRLFLVCALVLALEGCAFLSSLSSRANTPSAPSSAALTLPILDRGKSVLVAMPEDGHSASLWYVGSGRTVAYAVANAFSKRGVQVHLGEGRVKNDEVMTTALRAKAGYVVQPVITQWDQCNQWLGRPGRLSIRVSVIDVATARVVSSASINGFSYLASATLSTPDELLAGPLSTYLSALY